MMLLVQGKCENCGGLLKVDPTKKAAFCNYCGTPYVVQDAINNYTTNIGNLNLNFNTNLSAATRLDAAEAFLKLKKYDAARKAFEEASEITPQFYQVWWGQIRALSKEFTEELETKSELDTLYSLYESTLLFVPEDKKRALKQQFNAFYLPLLEQNQQRCAALGQKLQNLQNECDDLDSSIDEWTAKEYSNAHQQSDDAIWTLIFLPFAGFVLSSLAEHMVFFLIFLLISVVGLIYEFVVCPNSEAETAANYKLKERVLKDLNNQRDTANEEIAKVRQALNILSN